MRGDHKLQFKFIQRVRELTEKDIERCNNYRQEFDLNCKRCINACPAGKEASITIDDLNQATLGKIKASESIYKYAFSCMQTAKCSLACPVECKRDVMMLQLKSILSKPKEHHRYNLVRGTENHQVGKLAQKLVQWKTRKKAPELSNYFTGELKKAPTLFYFGCYLNTPEICLNTLKLADVFEDKGYEVLGMLETCCGYPQFLQGNFDLAEKYLSKLYSHIKKVEPEKIITSCMECFAALKILEEETDLDFKSLTSTDWILENKNKIDFSNIRKEEIIFHDSCVRCHKQGECNSPRDLLKLFAHVEEFDQRKFDSLCCTYYAFNFNKKNKSDLHEIKKDEIIRKGHHSLITECLTCDDEFKKDYKNEQFRVLNLVDYLAERLRNPNLAKIKYPEIVEKGELHECVTCNWVYRESRGDQTSGISSGTKFAEIPLDWNCPVCGVDKSYFKKVERRGNPLSYLGDWERDTDLHEPEMRSIYEKAALGKSSVSAMRSLKWKSPWEDIMFLPAQLAKLPLDKNECPVNLKTIIGPKAKKPLEMELPYYVSHMSFGSLSKEAKLALAKGSAAVKTAMCSGEGGMIPEERAASYKYIFEYSTGRFGVTEEVLRQADAIEIKVGQAAKAGLGGHLLGPKVTEEISHIRKLEPHKDVISPANHKDLRSKQDWLKLMEYLRNLSGGVPIGIKIVASKIEEDLEAALEYKPDFITIDCRGGSTGAAPTHIKDNVCYSAPYAIFRARKYLNSRGEKDITLIVTGGFRTSGDIAKALAMGADAVALATAAMIGIGCQQYRVCHDGTCPVGIATQEPRLRSRFDVEKSARMLTNLFEVYKHELGDFARICSKTNIHDLDVNDLAAQSREISDHTNIKHI